MSAYLVKALSTLKLAIVTVQYLSIFVPVRHTVVPVTPLQVANVGVSVTEVTLHDIAM